MASIDDRTDARPAVLPAGLQLEVGGLYLTRGGALVRLKVRETTGVFVGVLMAPDKPAAEGVIWSSTGRALIEDDDIVRRAGAVRPVPILAVCEIEKEVDRVFDDVVRLVTDAAKEEASRRRAEALALSELREVIRSLRTKDRLGDAGTLRMLVTEAQRIADETGATS